MSDFHDSDAYRYTEFFAGFTRAYPYFNLIKQYSRLPLPTPDAFSIHSVASLCHAAYYGHAVMPPSEEAFKAEVADTGAFTHSVRTRLREFHAEFIPLKNSLSARGVELELIENSSTPDSTHALAKLLGLDLGWLIEYEPQYHVDKRYLTAKYNERLNILAKEIGLPSYAKFKELLPKLNEYARDAGVHSYKSLCIPTAYLRFRSEELEGRKEFGDVVDVLGKKLPLLKKETPFVIDLFIHCRCNPEPSYWVDLSENGVEFSIKNGATVVEGVSTSKFNNQHDNFFGSGK